MSCLVSAGVVFCQVGYIGAAAVVFAAVQTAILAFVAGRVSA